MRSTQWAPRSVQTFDKNGKALARYLFTYDERGYKFTETKQVQDADKVFWCKNYRISYSYTIQGSRSRALKETYDTLTEKWLPASRTFYRYELSPFWPDTKIHQIYSTPLQEWLNASKDHYIRNKKDKLLFIVRELWDGERWDNHVKYSFLYNEQGVLFEKRRDVWNKTEECWVPEIKSTYTYNKRGNAVTETREIKDQKNSPWKQTGQFLYTYDTRGNATEVRYVPTKEEIQENITLGFFFNNMQSSVGQSFDDSGSFRGVKGTAEYFRQQR